VTRRDIVTIGGSAGGLKAVCALVAGLPPTIPTTIFVVLHSSPDSPRLLPEILSNAGTLPVRYAVNGEAFEPGTMYIAPPNHHMLIEASGQMRLTQGPKENRFRPAVDPLFRSAALAFSTRVAGVVLSGGLDDGVAGLAAIKQAGGLAIVQAPGEAEIPAMPRNALRHVAVDHCLPIKDIAALLEQVSRAPNTQGGNGRVTPKKELEIEVRMANEKEGFRSDILELGEPSPLTCPECHGVLLRMNDESILRFRCHTGHAYTAQSLLSALTEAVEDALWNSVRAIEESAMLLSHMVSHVAETDVAVAQDYRQASQIALGRAKALRSILADG
jgi:two-component system chemotaxis response regulator CheB